MKKAYVKPEIMFENFSLSTNIAGDCESIVGNASKGVCAVLGTGDVAIFSETMNACDYTTESRGNASDTYDGFCYHVPTSDKTLFNS